MKIAVVGTGYVGLVTGSMFAKVGNNVVCIDKNESKVEMLNRGEMPIFEPGLKQVVLDASSDNHLEFSSDISKINHAKVIVLAVGTPSTDEGKFNLDFIKSAAADIAKVIAGSSDLRIIVIKSTVPPGTSELVAEVIKENIPEEWRGQTNFEVVSNPEFLKEGKAVDDFEYPDRIIVGAKSEIAKDVLTELYEPFSLKKGKMIYMSPAEAELTKLFANTFLASKVALINEFASICSKFNADVMNVRNGLCSDKRIGWEFMFPSAGYGGSCFPKDIRGLVYAVAQKGLSPGIVCSIDKSNTAHKSILAREIKEYLETKGGLSGKTIALWGLTFKPKTDDMRESSTIYLINFLLENGAKVQAHDPKGMENAKKIFGDRISYFDAKYDALKDADVLLLMTEWSIYRSPDFDEIKSNLKMPVIFDGRNIYDPEKLNNLGFDYIGIGRKYLLN